MASIVQDFGEWVIMTSLQASTTQCRHHSEIDDISPPCVSFNDLFIFSLTIEQGAGTSISRGRLPAPEPGTNCTSNVDALIILVHQSSSMINSLAH